jgi:hypothetical protein
MNIVKIISENWYIITLTGALIYFAIKKLITLLSLPKEEQISMIKQIVYSLVVQAEKEFGSKTGSIKLANVIEKFYSTLVPEISLLLPQELVIKFIEEAVIKLSDYININESAKAAIYGEQSNDLGILYNFEEE